MPTAPLTLPTNGMFRWSTGRLAITAHSPAARDNLLPRGCKKLTALFARCFNHDAISCNACQRGSASPWVISYGELIEGRWFHSLRIDRETSRYFLWC